MASTRTAAMFSKEHCTVFTIGADSGILVLLGRGTFRTTVQTAENPAIKDTYETVKPTRYGGELSFTMSADTGLATDFSAAAVALTAVAFILQYDADQGYRAGNFVITDVSDVLEDGITIEVTGRLTGALDVTST